MKLALIISAVCISLAKGNSLLYCQQSGTHYYEEIGCKPLYGKCESCPLQYKCNPEEPKAGYCRVAGKLYGNGANFPNLGTCGCHCAVSGSKSMFSCIMAKCAAPTVEAGCHLKSNFNECCIYQTACPGSCSPRCLVDGNIYQDGQRFQPKNTCKECICQSGFIGIYEEPFCRPKNCGLELKFENRIALQPNLLYTCSPLYNAQDMCCPADFICNIPTILTPVTLEATTVERVKVEDPALDRSSQCRLGAKFYDRGQKLEFVYNQLNVRCECLIPPLFKCLYV